MSSVAELFRVYKTVIGMVTKRGYDTTKFSNLNFRDFKRDFVTNDGDINKSAMTIYVENVQQEQLAVFFCKDDKVGVGPIRTYYELMSAKNIRRAIVVIGGRLTPWGKAALINARTAGDALLECFLEAELKFDITTHRMVPEHQVLSNEEKAELLKRYKLKDTQLPRMKTTDPISRYFGLQKGDVVRIIRKSDTAGRYVTYRVVMSV